MSSGRDRERELREVLLHGLRPVRVELVAYDPTWPDHYRAEQARLEAALGDLMRMVEHIGSTSVPGLAAKPVIDIVIGLDDPDDETPQLARLEAIGYDLRVREPGHRCYRADPGPLTGARAVAAADPEGPGRRVARAAAGPGGQQSTVGGAASGPGGQARAVAVNLHCYQPQDDAVRRYLLFRDRLRADEGDRRRYESIKRSLAGREWPDMNLYADAKGPVIEEILARAGWTPPGD